MDVKSIYAQGEGQLRRGMSEGTKNAAGEVLARQLNVWTQLTALIASLVPIMLMVFTPMHYHPPGFSVDLPEAQHAVFRPTPDDAIRVVVRRDYSIYIDNLPIPQAEMHRLIQTKVQELKEPAVFLLADSQLTFDIVLDVINACRESGITKMVMVTNADLSVADIWAIEASKRSGR